MHSIDVLTINRDPAARLQFLEKFMGFTEEDRAALAESVPALSPRLPGLLDAVYEHLLSFDDTRRLFLGSLGRVDPDYVELRKEHLTTWLLTTVADGGGPRLAEYLVATARHHTSSSGDPGRNVPPRYVVGLFSYIQTLMWEALFAELPGEPEKARRYGLAWSKMLMMQLEIFLKEIAPAWPRWDEGV